MAHTSQAAIGGAPHIWSVVPRNVRRLGTVIQDLLSIAVYLAIATAMADYSR